MGKDTAQARKDLQRKSALVREKAARVLVEDQLNMSDVFGRGFDYDRRAAHELNRARVAARVARLKDGRIPEVDGVPAHLRLIVATLQTHGIETLIRVELDARHATHPIRVFCHPDPDDADSPTEFGERLAPFGLDGTSEAIQWWCCEEVNRVIALHGGTKADKAVYAEVLDAARRAVYADDIEKEA